LAGQCTRTRPRRRTRRAAGPGRHGQGRRPGPASAGFAGLTAPGRDEPGGGRAVPSTKDTGPVQRQREPGCQGARAEPQRTLSPHAEVWSMKELNYERRILLLALVAGFPGSAVAVVLLWSGDCTPKVGRRRSCPCGSHVLDV